MAYNNDSSGDNIERVGMPYKWMCGRNLRRDSYCRSC